MRNSLRIMKIKKFRMQLRAKFPEKILRLRGTARRAEVERREEPKMETKVNQETNEAEADVIVVEGAKEREVIPGLNSSGRQNPNKRMQMSNRMKLKKI